jgi:hypothetical protein
VSDIFEIGEVALWQNLEAEDTICNGQECVITSQMMYDQAWDRHTNEPTETYLGYEVRDEEGEWFAAIWELRKKPPPQDRHAIPRVRETELV